VKLLLDKETVAFSPPLTPTAATKGKETARHVIEQRTGTASRRCIAVPHPCRMHAACMHGALSAAKP
jgi:hypothetical protein